MANFIRGIFFFLVWLPRNKAHSRTSWPQSVPWILSMSKGFPAWMFPTPTKDITGSWRLKRAFFKDLTNMLLERNEEMSVFHWYCGWSIAYTPKIVWLHFRFGGDGWDESSAVDKTYLPTWKRPEKLTLTRFATHCKPIKTKSAKKLSINDPKSKI